MTETRLPYFTPELMEADPMEGVRVDAMNRIIRGQFNKLYSKWLLRGKEIELSQEHTVALAIFPMFEQKSGQIVLQPQVKSYGTPHEYEPAAAYWRAIEGLVPPEERIKNYEKNLPKNAVIDGDQIFYAMLPMMIQDLLPTAMVVFNRRISHVASPLTDNAVLFWPTLVPPSATYRHLQEQVHAVVGNISRMM